MSKRVASILVALALAACGAPRPRPPAPPPSAPQTPGQPTLRPQPLPAPGTYRIESSSSELRVLVYRAGALGSFGHNHVMVNRTLSGTVQLAATLQASSFSISAPVADFIVDDAQARLDAGGDFPGDIPQDAKSATYHNMLSAAVLNAAQFPAIKVKSAAITGTQDALSADVTINVAGHESSVHAPFTLESDSRRLTATGSLELKQTAIGLTPYSLMLGALQVQDAMLIKFKLVVPISQ